MKLTTGLKWGALVGVVIGLLQGAVGYLGYLTILRRSSLSISTMSSYHKECPQTRPAQLCSTRSSGWGWGRCSAA
ncbi:hypothetical protein [Pyrobaculum aerophilum]|uniref:hypothetical protein n=1 Tax=Pyrobaculum aerophilum TaxID=13773 RepID=UPI0011C06102|nr:hypothetical protein [Pyrobaculum aerophilum]